MFFSVCFPLKTYIPVSQHPIATIYIAHKKLDGIPNVEKYYKKLQLLPKMDLFMI